MCCNAVCCNIEGGAGWISGNNGLQRSSSSTELRAMQDQVCMFCLLVDGI